MMHNVKLFILLNSEAKIRLLEAFFYLGWGRILKALPFAMVSPLLGNQSEETSSQITETNIHVLKHISESIEIMSRYTPWDSQCLVKAIAGQKMLRRRHMESTLYLGTAKDANDELIAHSWLRSGSYYVTGKAGMRKFTVVATFAMRTNSGKSVGDYHG
ncbi:lasso peptide biosynthesis B2 protein [Virgibacillus sp. AGTR]|uniref:lasso peptide biosynthesis B2 protein n=1 Tax=unclassified Virgibacillus TaxID=2620237 RepID=UPI001D04C07E|nr:MULTISPECIES: lasso peptide biosynthesis B2 protein [unclassified Virgibacillus]MCC2251754.1 lasso peptide biosynthesis B2 protein [Virgibacillus sp. AGTR]MDY7044706.1 lasso peptide biosynthesis B2 protein [Virgibacillus sp. M23]